MIIEKSEKETEIEEGLTAAIINDDFDMAHYVLSKHNFYNPYLRSAKGDIFKLFVYTFAIDEGYVRDEIKVLAQKKLTKLIKDLASYSAWGE